jgi:hypothetical protein
VPRLLPDTARQSFTTPAIKSVFKDLCDARHDNEDRPHSAIGYNVPIDKHYPDGVTSPPSGSEPENFNFRRSGGGA